MWHAKLIFEKKKYFTFYRPTKSNETVKAMRDVLLNHAQLEAIRESSSRSKVCVDKFAMRANFDVQATG